MGVAPRQPRSGQSPLSGHTPSPRNLSSALRKGQGGALRDAVQSSRVGRYLQGKERCHPLFAGLQLTWPQGNCQPSSNTPGPGSHGHLGPCLIANANAGEWGLKPQQLASPSTNPGPALPRSAHPTCSSSRRPSLWPQGLGGAAGSRDSRDQTELAGGLHAHPILPPHPPRVPTRQRQSGAVGP